MPRYEIDIREMKPDNGPGCLVVLGWWFLIYVIFSILSK